MGSLAGPRFPGGKQSRLGRRAIVGWRPPPCLLLDPLLVEHRILETFPPFQVRLGIHGRILIQVAGGRFDLGAGGDYGGRLGLGHCLVLA